MPTSPKLPISTSLSDLEKSEETTQSDPVAVVRAIKRVLGDVTMFVKGPLEIRWSILSSASRVMMVFSVEYRISECPEVDWSGGMIVHEWGGSVNPAISIPGWGLGQ
jgi:hypothetical protein